MQNWLDDHILIYSTHNEGKSVVAGRFRRNLKGNISKNVTANDSKSYLSQLNKQVDEYDNTCHCSIDKKTIDADYFALTEEVKSSQKAPKFEFSDRVRTANYKKLLKQCLHLLLVKRNICD